MSHSPSVSIEGLSPDAFRLGDRAGGLVGRCAVVGVVALAAAAAIGLSGDQGTLSRFLHAYTTAYAYFVSIALGAMVFVLFQHVTSAGWSVTVRRIAELLTGAFPLLGVLGLPLVAAALLGVAELYPWADPDGGLVPDHVAHLVHKKAGYLNPVFFTIRMVLYFAVWIWMANWFRKQSEQQDLSGDPGITNLLKKRSAPMIPVFALTLSFFAIDILMALDPVWYSTIFGVYYFAGGFAAFMALLGILANKLGGEDGVLAGYVRDEHFHDIGKLTFAFVMFWGYIAFSQYILIWYANIPEETAWYAEREHAFWGNVAALFILKFLVPWLGLLSRHIKRHPKRLVFFGGWVLVMHLYDMFFLAMPSHLNTLHYLEKAAPNAEAAEGWHHAADSFATFPVGLLELACVIGVGALFVAAVAKSFAGSSLLAVRDPRLPESMKFHNP